MASRDLKGLTAASEEVMWTIWPTDARDGEVDQRLLGLQAQLRARRRELGDEALMAAFDRLFAPDPRDAS